MVDGDVDDNEVSETSLLSEDPVAADSTTETVIYDDSYTVAKLREIAKEKGITDYSSMTKAELLEVLNNGNNG